ncbi:hypothetical protein KIN20_020907 [Parelaphostrongylus tenuis]|uniref:Uncharacterized protein n=1 Tax=Parelaphostrongylus tenuis TaxID=148309 RepID=A0AAD5QTT6_PARTN|nr:hypothetical protein KIN20_020907 [Parelaphostrongylus tenuis]
MPTSSRNRPSPTAVIVEAEKSNSALGKVNDGCSAKLTTYPAAAGCPPTAVIVEAKIDLPAATGFPPTAVIVEAEKLDFNSSKSQRRILIILLRYTTTSWLSSNSSNRRS